MLVSERPEQCGHCRYFDIEPDDRDNFNAGDGVFGWCRRHPPKVVDHMARQSIPSVGFGGNNHDPEDIATVGNVYNASLCPAVFSNHWCGEYMATDPVVPL